MAVFSFSRLDRPCLARPSFTGVPPSSPFLPAWGWPKATVTSSVEETLVARTRQWAFQGRQTPGWPTRGEAWQSRPSGGGH